MPLLFDEDYIKLRDHGYSFEESEQQRFFIFTNIQLQPGQYTVANCDVLVMIPGNYNQDGNDMFWTFPRLFLTSGNQIPAVMDSGGGDNRVWKNREFCRWSRHWNSGNGVWRPGKDNIISIYRRIDWALRNPEKQ